MDSPSVETFEVKDRSVSVPPFDAFIARLTSRSLAEMIGPRPALREKITSHLPANAAEVVARTLNFSRRPVDQPAPEFSETESRALLVQDAEEQSADRACIAVAAAAKAAVARELADIAAAELATNPGNRPSSTSELALIALLDQSQKNAADLQTLQSGLSDLGETIDPLAIRRNTRDTLGLYSFLASQTAGLMTSNEYVSPARGHTGPFFARVIDISPVPDLEKTSGYSRFRPGTFTRLLTKDIDAQYGLPPESNVSRKQIEAYTSGMGGLGSILDQLHNLHSEIVISDGFYFELIASAEKSGFIATPVPVDENYYLTAAGKLRQDTAQPLAFMAQPFSSGINETNFDLDRLLTVVETTDFTRPVYIVLDTTMHGPSLQAWDRINALNRAGKNVTYIEAQSLVKHGQLGMDKVPGGIAIGYGSNPDVISATAGARAAIMPEFTAACLLPFSAETQLHRIQRAGRNADHLYHFLREKITANPLFEGVVYASADTSQNYSTKSPFLFLKVNPLIGQYFEQALEYSVRVASHSLPDTTAGTSYGFNGTRFESISIGRDRSPVFRIAAGQESILNLMALEAHLGRTLDDPAFIENASAGLNQEIYALTEYSLPHTNKSSHRTSFNPQHNSKDSTHLAFDALTNRDATSFLSNSLRGYQISNELKNPHLREVLKVSSEKLDGLNSLLPPLPEVRAAFVQWQIAQPEFIEAFRAKLTVAGKSPSPETAYLLAHAATDIKGVRLVLAPVAKMVKDILTQLKPLTEARFKAPLPFEL